MRADYYSDNGPLLSVQAENTGENGWKFIIPEQEPGSIIYYRIYAADSDNVEGMTGFFAYIAGEYKKYDSGLFSYYKLIGNDQAMAVRISADETSVQQLSSVLIRTLYESVTSFKGININIRSDMNGQPGDLIAEPVYFEAWSTSQKPSEFSIIDLRSRNIRVKGDFWIGLTVDSGFVAVPEEAPYETGTTAYGRSVIGNISGSELVWEDDPDYNYHFRAVLGPLSGIDAHENVSVDNILYQNYPNPFNPFTEISYSLKSEGMVTLSVFNTKGELVSSLVNEKKTAGNYFARFNADGLNSGIYFYKLSVDGKLVDSKRMLMIK